MTNTEIHENGHSAAYDHNVSFRRVSDARLEGADSWGAAGNGYNFARSEDIEVMGGSSETRTFVETARGR